MSATIEIHGLRVQAYIGVPDDERAEPQELRLHLIMTPALGFGEMADEISRTIDYAVVAEEVKALALSRPRRLIETLAEEIADHLLIRHGSTRVEVRLEKRILPDTDFVAVHRIKEAP